MEILISNDDGIHSRGIALLERVMTVVAPDGPRSGFSNFITSNKPITLQKVSEDAGGVRYVSSGSPTDCVKLALNELFADRKPDLLVSGINHGSNAAICVIYSGTMGAVFEGCVNGILSIGFSICDYDPDVNLDYLEPYIEEITSKLMEIRVPYGTCFNVNAPIGPIKGVRIARQCKGHWEKEFVRELLPDGDCVYRLTGNFNNHEPLATDTDEHALANGYISIVPTTTDMTDYDTWHQLDF